MSPSLVVDRGHLQDHLMGLVAVTVVKVEWTGVEGEEIRIEDPGGEEVDGMALMDD